MLWHWVKKSIYISKLAHNRSWLWDDHPSRFTPRKQAGRTKNGRQSDTHTHIHIYHRFNLSIEIQTNALDEEISMIPKIRNNVAAYEWLWRKCSFWLIHVILGYFNLLDRNCNFRRDIFCRETVSRMPIKIRLPTSNHHHSLHYEPEFMTCHKEACLFDINGNCNCNIFMNSPRLIWRICLVVSIHIQLVNLNV